jgi:archaellum component FlaC
MISKKLLEEVEYYSNHPWDEVKDDIKTDTEKLDALNKGIDELIKKYEEEGNINTSEINHWTDERKNSTDSNYKEYCMCIAERNKEAKILTRIFIKDLKKLKGE